jgi:hypothetical protein
MKTCKHIFVTSSPGGLQANNDKTIKTNTVTFEDLRKSYCKTLYGDVVSINAGQKARLTSAELIEYGKEHLQEIKKQIIGNEIALVRLPTELSKKGEGAGLLVRGNSEELRQDFKAENIVAIVMHDALLEPLEKFVDEHNAKLDLRKASQVVKEDEIEDVYESALSHS